MNFFVETLAIQGDICHTLPHLCYQLLALFFTSLALLLKKDPSWKVNLLIEIIFFDLDWNRKAGLTIQFHNPIFKMDCKSQFNPPNWLAIQIEQSINPIQQHLSWNQCWKKWFENVTKLLKKMRGKVTLRKTNWLAHFSPINILFFKLAKIRVNVVKKGKLWKARKWDS